MSNGSHTNVSPTLDPERTAFIVVDMQEFFCRPDSTFSRFVSAMDPDGATWYQDRVDSVVIPTISGLLDRFRAARAMVVFTELGSRRSDGADFALWARRHNEISTQVVGAPCYPPLDDPSSRVVSELTPLPGELVVQKTTSGPLAGTALEHTLRRCGIDTVVVTGVVTDVCVLGMARELADSDFDAYVVSDGCATVGESTHEAILQSLARIFAFTPSSAEVLAMLEETGEPVLSDA